MSSALLAYVQAWVDADAERIAGLVGEDCVVTECYGPVYRGREIVRRWAHTWFAEGGRVHLWQVDDHVVMGDREVAVWTFECTWNGERSRFEGATIARVEGGLIRTLREYQTTAELYDWSGTWR